MHRLTTRYPAEHRDALEALVEDGEFLPKSEAVCLAVRDLVEDSGRAHPKPAYRRATRADGGREVDDVEWKVRPP